jgi:hypothetical protein
VNVVASEEAREFVAERGGRPPVRSASRPKLVFGERP